MENLRETIFRTLTRPETILKIKTILPKLFQIAESECSRAGKIGMEVGSLREKIIISFLINTFGNESVETFRITEPEADVKVNGIPLSIKTITGNGGIKAVWTVDASSAQTFLKNYQPKCDIILVKIDWKTGKGGLFVIPIEVQQQLFKSMKEDYLQLPKQGTNPRGVEFNKSAVEKMLVHKDTIKILIDWKKEKIEYDVYKRWVDYWSNKI